MIEDWPPVNGDYTSYNREASLGVVFIGNVDWEVPGLEEDVAISGKLMTPQGTERLVYNVISNPNIRDLVVVGEDVPPFLPKDALLCLYEDGMDEEKKIKDTEAKVSCLTNLTDRHVDEFQRQILNVRRLDSREDLEGFVENRATKEAYDGGLDLEDEDFSIEPSVPKVPFTKSGYYIEAEDLVDAWRRTLRTVWNSGKEVMSQEGKTKELLNLEVHIRNPLQKDIDGYPLGPEELENYAESLVHPKLGEDVEYTYGLRLRVRKEQIVDQVKQVVERLKKSPGTRRAVAVLWIPDVDGKKDSGQPCLISIDFKIRDGKLHLSGIMRSNDMYGAVPSNWYGLACLNKHVAKKVGVEPGTVTTISHSAHVYANDYSSIKEVVEKERKTGDYLEDELGYFVVEIDRERGRIEVSFFDEEGKLNRKFEGENATDLRKRIIKNEIVSLKEHAAYLGEQLARAEYALKNGTEFDQDGA